ncbi:MAG: tetratricopeptide repeat protein [Limisphaerales bacterium]
MKIHATRVSPMPGIPRARGRLTVGSAALGFIIAVGGADVPPSTSEPGTAGTHAVVDLRQTDEAQTDRELRAEQLRVARQLYDALPRSDAAFVMGLVSNEQGDVDSAIRYWKEETRGETDSGRLRHRAEAFLNLGEVYQAKGDFAQAAAMLREAIRLSPGRLELQLRLAEVFYAEGRMDECLRALAEGKVASPGGLTLRGQARQRLGQLEEARRSFADAIELDPNLAEAHYGLATTLSRLGRPDEAAAARERFQALQAGHQSSGRERRSQLDPLAITRQSLAQTHTAAGWVYQTHQLPEQAESLWRRAAEVDPANTACRFHLMMLYQQAGRNEEALRRCEEMIRVEPNNAFHQLSLGNLLARLKQPEATEAAYRKAIELAPRRSEGYFALAQFHLSSRTKLAEAVVLARKATELAPLAPNYYVLSQACLKTGDRAAARIAIEHACRLDPGNARFNQLRHSLENDRDP